MERICCDLPEEVMVEIFSWLPPESLIRFKCVSKPWYSLINFLIKNPEFVNKHLRNNDNKILSSTTCLVFSCLWTVFRWEMIESPPRDPFKLVTIFHDEDNEIDRVDCVVEDIQLPTLPIIDSLRSHCNGVICTAFGSRLILCNPAIKEWRTLPKPCIPFRRLEVRRVGFGYDSRANDYKVVRLGVERLLRDQREYFKARAEVYSMGSDSWREIETRIEFHYFPTLDKEVFCEGVFYWSVWAGKHIILSFDLFEEVFQSIVLPDNLVVRREEQIKLVVWNESIAIFVYPSKKGIPKLIEVWVMDDCSSSVQVSWIKKLIIGPLVDIVSPLSLLKNDELLMTATGGFILYNLRNQKLRKFIVNEEANRIMFWEFSYVKSLVSVEVRSQSS